jgi:CheY-like chemotaxis protein
VSTIIANMTKIMLVEDDKSLREIYGVRLLAEGYDIISAGDGEEALAMAIKDRPQLIISDVMMPKISGFDMLDILRSTTETKNIRVIMMTALSSDEQRQRGEQLGADKYLVKSQVGIEDVIKAVHEVLQDVPGAANQPAPTPVQSTMPQATPAPVQAPTPTAPSMPPQPSLTSAPPAPGSQIVGAVATEPESSSIPEPTAPFTGQRPASLGERVIQPLKDNPRVSNVDMNELIDKEFATSVQSVENTPVTNPGGPQPVSLPSDPGVATPAPVSMEPPVAPQPANDGNTTLQAAPVAPAPNPYADGTTTAASPTPAPTTQPGQPIPPPVQPQN